MGFVFSRIFDSLAGQKEVRILILGTYFDRNLLTLTISQAWITLEKPLYYVHHHSNLSYPYQTR